MRCALHVSLNVSDLPRSVDFYRRLFGEPAKLKPGYAKFVSADPELHLVLQPGRPPGRESALSHLGIRVASSEEVVRRKEVLGERGLSGADETGTVCCYALQDKFWVSDPDGNRWEIYTVLQDVEEERGARSSCCAGEASPVALG